MLADEQGRFRIQMATRKELRENETQLAQQQLRQLMSQRSAPPPQPPLPTPSEQPGVRFAAPISQPNVPTMGTLPELIPQPTQPPQFSPTEHWSGRPSTQRPPQFRPMPPSMNPPAVGGAKSSNMCDRSGANGGMSFPPTAQKTILYMD